MEIKAFRNRDPNVQPLASKDKVDEVTTILDNEVTLSAENRTVSQGLCVIAAPFAGGQDKAGVEDGPQTLINAGLLTDLTNTLNYRILYNLCPGLSLSNDLPHRGMKAPRTVSSFAYSLAQQAHTLARNSSPNSKILALGGDHSIAIGSIAGIAKATRERTGVDLGVIWVDAHADINLPETSESGNIHGMPLAFLTGLARSHEAGVFDWLLNDHLVRTEKLVYIGLRSVDAGEEAILQQHRIKAFDMETVRRIGLPATIAQALAHLGASTPLHLSFDIDALDPAFAPSTGTPVPAGLTLEEGLFVVRKLAETGRLNSMDLVEVNPWVARDEAGVERTVRAGKAIVEAGLGAETL